MLLNKSKGVRSLHTSSCRHLQQTSISRFYLFPFPMLLSCFGGVSLPQFSVPRSVGRSQFTARQPDFSMNQSWQPLKSQKTSFFGSSPPQKKTEAFQRDVCTTNSSFHRGDKNQLHAGNFHFNQDWLVVEPPI